MPKLVLPNDSQRCAVFGKTGSGKTQAGVWQLSLRSYTSMPWIIIDFKSDELINRIPYAVHLEDESGSPDFSSVPDMAGIYIIHPTPADVENGALDEFMYLIWARGRCGLFVDECFMVGRNSKSFNAILTQGRSKKIPVIACSQRPAWISNFVFSEADFFQVFWLNFENDRKKVAAFTPINPDLRPPEYESIWYNVNKDILLELLPVPDAGTILATFEERLRPQVQQVLDKPRKRMI